MTKRLRADPKTFRAFRFVWADRVICGHIRFLPLMRRLDVRKRAETGPILHGVEAWQPFGGAETLRQIGRLDRER